MVLIDKLTFVSLLYSNIKFEVIVVTKRQDILIYAL